MTGQVRRFEPVELPDPSPPPDPALARAANAAAISALSLGLKTLSQRALASTKDIFTLLSVGSVFWLWSWVADPSLSQIVSQSIYAMVILTANVIVRRV